MIKRWARRFDAWYRGICFMCGMPKTQGHWPGCDFWRGENLDLFLIFYGKGEKGDGEEE